VTAADLLDVLERNLAEARAALADEAEGRFRDAVADLVVSSASLDALVSAW
jgi:hypothetical protein